MTAEEEEADAVRRSNRQRRPPAHLSDDDYPASDAEPASEDDKAARIARKLQAYSGAPNWPGAPSDDSDQSCYGEALALPKPLVLLCNISVLARMLVWYGVCGLVLTGGAS